MSFNPFDLKAVDALISQIDAAGDAEGFQLLKILRGYYQSDTDLDTLASISSATVIDALWPADQRPQKKSPQSFAKKVERLAAVRDRLNRKFTGLQEKQANPLGILIDDANTFKRLSRRTFHKAEMSFELPQTLLEEFQQQVDRVRQQNEEATGRLQLLAAEETALAQIRGDLEREKSGFRTRLQERLGSLESAMTRQKNQYEQEMERLREELTSLRAGNLQIQSDHRASLQSQVENQLDADREHRNQARQFTENFQNLSELMDTLTQEQESLVRQSQKSLQRLRQQEQSLKKAAAAHRKGLQECLSRQNQFEAARKNTRQKLEREYQEKFRGLQQDFQRQAAYFQRRMDEETEQKRRMEEENNQLLKRKQNLNREIHIRTEAHFKKRQEEMDKREAALAKTRQAFFELGKQMHAARKHFLSARKPQGPSRYVHAELQDLAVEQLNLLEKIRVLADHLETHHRGEKDQEKARGLHSEKESQEFLENLKKDRDRYLQDLAQLKEREKKLDEREVNELTRLQEEYEDLKTSMEVAEIEKEDELEERQKELLLREQELSQQVKDQAALHKTLHSQLDKQEEEILEEMGSFLSIKINLANQQAEVRQFLDNAQSTFQSRLEGQAANLQDFKGRMEGLESATARFKDEIERQSERSQAQQASFEQSLRDQIHQHEEFMNTLEKGLEEQVETYRRKVDQLQSTRGTKDLKDRDNLETFLKNITDHQERLQAMGKAFEELSETFQEEQKLGKVQVHSDNAAMPAAPAEPSGESTLETGRQEWQKALAGMLHEHQNPRGPVSPFLEKWGEQWSAWIDAPPGEFIVGPPGTPAAAPRQTVRIDQPLKVGRYPVTNLEFYRFVRESGYLTESEREGGGIVYFSGHHPDNGESRSRFSNPTLEQVAQAAWWRPNSRSDALLDKWDHPVTQVTLNDALEFCRWKSEQMGCPVRLLTENEWEYVASNHGQRRDRDLPWTADECTRFCNVEETGLGETTPVNFFPEHELTGGVLDMFGNVYEWVQEGPAVQRTALSGKMQGVRGGSYLTLCSQVSSWRRLAFLPDYRTSFLGFRIACEIGSGKTAIS